LDQRSKEVAARGLLLDDFHHRDTENTEKEENLTGRPARPQREARDWFRDDCRTVTSEVKILCSAY